MSAGLIENAVQGWLRIYLHERHKRMFIVVLIVLILLTIGVLEQSISIALVLGGLLWMIWYLHSKLSLVNKQFKELEATLAELLTVKSDSLENDLTAGPQATDAVAVDESALEQSVTIKAMMDDDNAFKAEMDAEAAPSSSINAIDDESSSSSDQGLSDPIENHVQDDIEAIDQASILQAKTAIPKQPATPRGPNVIEKLIAAAWNWVTDGNVFVRVGIIVLFMGMTFLTRYAIGQNLIPIELRLAVISAVALGLLFWGWKQRHTKQHFSLVVQGGGIGLLYLTIFAGFSLYDVIPSGFAFVLLAIVVVLTAVLAVVQDARSLALFATIGGFLAPVLTSSGSNNYIGLFSYYTLLNLGVFSVAWFKSWRILNFTGFIFTFLISTVWGVLSYQEEFFSTTEPFLIVFFLLYVAIGILFAHKRTPFYKDYIDSSLVFGTPIFAFGLQCAMVKNYDYGVAISAVALGVFYLLLTSVLWKKFGSRLRLLSETSLSLGVIFTTLAIPFAIDGYLSGAAWAIEGAGILWVSIKQEQKYRRYFAAALIFAAGPMLLYGLQTAETASPFINSFFIGCVIITIAATLASWLLSKDYAGKTAIESPLSIGILCYAVAVLLGGFEIEIIDFELFEVHGALLALLSGAVMIIYTAFASKLNWSKGHWLSVGFVLPLSIAAVLSVSYQAQLSDNLGYLLWPTVLFACFYGFRKAVNVIDTKVLLVAHILAATTIVGLFLWDGLWQLMLGYSILAIVFNGLSKRFDWPQLKLIALGFFPVLVLCGLLAIGIDGDLVTLSNIAGSVRPPFPPGILLWPFSFVVYFYLVYQNRRFCGNKNKYFHYAGGALIAVLLIWLGSGPLLLGASLLSVLFCMLWQKFDWIEMRIMSMTLLPAMLLSASITLLTSDLHLANLSGLNIFAPIEAGFYLWPLSFIALFWTYWKYDQQSQAAPALFHATVAVLLCFVLTWEVLWHLLDYFDLLNAWLMAWVPLVSIIAIAVILRSSSWPLSRHKQAYQSLALPLLVLVPIVWSFLQLLSSGGSEPLPWIPIINPLDIVQIIILMGALLWGPKRMPTVLQRLTPRLVFYCVGGFAFLWANVELLRGVHHWASIPWQLPTILSADISQTVIALFWAFSGLLVTIFASKRHDRTLWFFGGALLVAVVLKLFLVDLSAQDTIERIISFTGVGLLLVAVGYFSPLPPREVLEKSMNDEPIDEKEMDEVKGDV